MSKYTRVYAVVNYTEPDGTRSYAVRETVTGWDPPVWRHLVSFHATRAAAEACAAARRERA